MTQAGFAGNQRYLIVTTAVVCVLGGMGAVRVLQGVEWLARRRFGPRRAPAIVAAAVLLGVLAGSPTIVAKANNEARVRGGLEHEAYLWHDLQGLIDEAGGKDSLLACGGVFSGPFQTQMVAYELGIHGIQVGLEGDAAAGGHVPHADGPRRAARDQADRRPLPAGRHQRQVARCSRCRRSGAAPVRRPSRYAPTAGTAGNVATKDAPLEVIGDPQRPQGDK